MGVASAAVLLVAAPPGTIASAWKSLEEIVLRLVPS